MSENKLSFLIGHHQVSHQPGHSSRPETHTLALESTNNSFIKNSLPLINLLSYPLRLRMSPVMTHSVHLSGTFSSSLCVTRCHSGSTRVRDESRGARVSKIWATHTYTQTLMQQTGCNQWKKNYISKLKLKLTAVSLDTHFSQDLSHKPKRAVLSRYTREIHMSETKKVRWSPNMH